MQRSFFNRKEGTTEVTTSHSNDGWAGWDEAKDDGYDNFNNGASSKKAIGDNGKSDASWSGGGFPFLKREKPQNEPNSKQRWRRVASIRKAEKNLKT
ncbi:hypothetical protein GOBAR_AA14330 [Gossypium barbadense]|uniref:Uncharacterized protein n=1 Tax=Gossypium barbadense TaxID=3634 RepID=A0A2P5XSH2_GOSBA|nr:hypothetical protein GOBAR_AA14330 [Gossypium barbadense]